jgi:hypothetical protein
MKKAPKLTPEQLAKAVAQTYAYLEGDTGKVHGSYDGGGWITVTGHNLPAHPDLRDKYPNGWSMMERIRTSEARQRLIEACR